MEITFGTVSEIFQLASVIYCDDREKVDAAVIFGETKSNTSDLVSDLANIFLFEAGVKK